MVIGGCIATASQAATMAALMIPVVGEYGFGFAQHVGKRNNPFSIVSSRCLSLAPCTTSVATTRIPKWSYSSTLREAILSPVRGSHTQPS
jgi:hypothetical protein